MLVVNARSHYDPFPVVLHPTNFFISYVMFDKRLAITLILIMNLMNNMLHAADSMEILMVYNNGQEFHRTLAGSTRSWLQKHGTQGINTVLIDRKDTEDYLQEKSTQIRLVVCIGTSSTSTVLSLDTGLPVYSVAIPRLSFDKLKSPEASSSSNIQPRHFNALYLDQPVERRLDLIAEILPGAKKIGLLLGPASQAYKNTIHHEVDHRQWQLLSAEVSQQSQIVGSLDKILDSSDVMLGLVDPLVFNRTSSRKILLTAYRWRVPLIGISAAYVRAGALAAVSSTPSQLGRQLAEILDRYIRAGGSKIPASQFPKYFDVSINFQVAESLGLHIGKEDDIKNKLLQKGKIPP